MTSIDTATFEVSPPVAGNAPRDVTLAFPHPGNVATPFMIRTISALYCTDSRLGEVADLQTGPGIGLARNKMVRSFLDSPCEWLWMCDTDMLFSNETLPALLSHADPEERPVVGAFCCVVNNDVIKPSLYMAAEDADGKFGFAYLEKWPHDELIRVDATGAGCLLMHKSVFKRISEANPDDDGLWFAEMIIGGNQIGEDMSFCIRCRAAGIPVYVHTGIEVGHVKLVQLGKVSP